MVAASLQSVVDIRVSDSPVCCCLIDRFGILEGRKVLMEERRPPLVGFLSCPYYSGSCRQGARSAAID